MSLDVYLKNESGEEVFTANITHNLGKMAKEAGIYQCLWAPDQVGILKAEQMIVPLHNGLIRMVLNPTKYKEFNADNGWGKYSDFLEWVAEYLEACTKNPDATVTVSR